MVTILLFIYKLIYSFCSLHSLVILFEFVRIFDCSLFNWFYGSCLLLSIFYGILCRSAIRWLYIDQFIWAMRAFARTIEFALFSNSGLCPISLFLPVCVCVFLSSTQFHGESIFQWKLRSWKKIHLFSSPSQYTCIYLSLISFWPGVDRIVNILECHKICDFIYPEMVCCVLYIYTS